MPWSAQLELDYRRDGERCIVHDRHHGPLRVLASLYPEGNGVCHNVIVHPPGGIVGGDELGLTLRLGASSHALLTTPGATRFYRSAGAPARQTLRARLQPHARLEWLPHETCCHAGALAHSALHFELDAGAEMIGWDVLSLGLPTSELPFLHGRYTQTITLGQVWHEFGVVDGSDRRLLESPLGLAGHSTLGLMWFGAGTPVGAARREALLDAARGVCAADSLRTTAGATSPHEEIVLLRVLAARVEPVLQLLHAVWAAWRPLAWGMAACPPRVWRT
jgi:urease accessory protein